MGFMMIRRHSSAAKATEAQWRADVSLQLARLAEVQAKINSQQMEDRERLRASKLAWGYETALLLVSAAVVLGATKVGMTASMKAGTASSLRTLANSALTQESKVIQPILTLQNRKGPTYFGSHATSVLAAAVNNAARLAYTVRSDSDAASAAQTSADRWQLASSGMLAFGSALGGAVLGWMLTPWLGRQRWPKRTGHPQPATRE
jgi:hypothetical protein